MVLTTMILATVALLTQADAEQESKSDWENPVKIQIMHPEVEHPPDRGFTASFTAGDLQAIFQERPELLPLPLQVPSRREAIVAALDRVSMHAVVDAMLPFLTSQFSDRFNPDEDLMAAVVPADRQVTLEAPQLDDGRFRGPSSEVLGFLLHDIDEATYVRVAIRTAQIARQLLESGAAGLDRRATDYYRQLAVGELDELVASQEAQAAKLERARKIREQVARSLGIMNEEGDIDIARANWTKESRRFSYVIKDGEFIARLQPLVQRINEDIELAGFVSEGSIDKPGIHFDPDLGDVEILLPPDLLEAFLSQADELERRMAADAMISIEVVRLTDRDIVDGVVATRVNGSFQGVHDVKRGNRDSVLAGSLGINAFTAAANDAFAATDLSAYTVTDRRFTNFGTDFSVGADEAFFDGRENRYSFHYIGPDGLRHVMSFDVADSLRKFWERIENNLILHKIRKTDKLEKFTVPVGPDTKVFEGLAALIQQQNQEIVVSTGTGAQSKLSATAGTWLVIKDFEILPIPGSSTALTEAEEEQIRFRVLVTMALRDPLIPVEVKNGLIASKDQEDVRTKLDGVLQRNRRRQLRPGLEERSFGAVYAQRYADSRQDAATRKRERNSKIVMTFFSSQGIILAQPGATALGDSNDLTSFTTELTPNKVTAISSFFTKTGSSTKDKATRTDLPRGEQKQEQKTMSHLVLRASFPTLDGERRDRQEGRYLGYFDLPSGREPLSTVHLPFLSSSEHPLERLAKMSPGLMFRTLDRSRVRQIKRIVNPQRLVGDVPMDVWEACTTRWLLINKMLSDSPTKNQAFADRSRQEFIATVRSLLEYDEDLFDVATLALLNMRHWNDSYRIERALYNSNQRFALDSLVGLVDRLGGNLLSDDFVHERLAAVDSKDFWGHVRLRTLTDLEVLSVRRDVALHYMRLEELFGDAFLEAAATLLGLGNYNSLDFKIVEKGSFRSYLDLVYFDRNLSLYRTKEDVERARQQFFYLREGGYTGGGWGTSFQFLKDLDPRDREFVIHGKEILERRDSRTSTYEEE